MSKHKSKKRNLKKTVKRKVQKLQELTAEELLMNPTLLQSPQFKQLPMEKQFQLVSQLKHLKSLFGLRNNAAPIYSSGNNTDPGLLTRINELNNKASRQAIDNENLKKTLEQANLALQHQKDLERDIRKRSQEQKDSINQQAQIDNLQQQIYHLQQQEADTRARNLENQVRKLKKTAHVDNLNEKQKEYEEVNEEFNQLLRVITPPNQNKHEGFERNQKEKYIQAKRKKLDFQENLQNQINDLTSNGLANEAEEAENELNMFNQNFNPEYILTTDSVPVKKKVLNSEEEEDFIETFHEEEEFPANQLEEEEATEIPVPPLSPIESNGIKAEVQLNRAIQTQKEKKEQAEALLKQQQQNQQKIERELVKDSNNVATTINTKLSFEENKADLLKKLDEVIAMVENPDPSYRTKLIQKINDAKSFNDLNIVSRKLALDKSNQEVAVQLGKIVESQKEECLQKLLEIGRKNYIGFQIPFDAWRVMIIQAKTTEQILKIGRMIDISNRAYSVLSNPEVKQQLASTNEDTKSKANALINEASKDLIEVQQFLSQGMEKVKPIIYYDSTKENEFSPGLKSTRLSQDFKYIDVSKYKYYPHASSNALPNDILLNGVNLFNLIKRVGLSSERGQFMANALWKLSKAVGKIGKNASFTFLKFAGQVIIAAIPALMKNQTLALSVLGGIGSAKLLQMGYEYLFKNGTPTADEIEEALTKADQNKILNLTDEEIDEQVQRIVDNINNENGYSEEQKEKDLIKLQNLQRTKAEHLPPPERTMGVVPKAKKTLKEKAKQFDKEHENSLLYGAVKYPIIGPYQSVASIIRYHKNKKNAPK